MPIKRMVVLAASAVLLCAVLVTIRGISHVPPAQPSAEDPTLTVDPFYESDLGSTVELHIEVSMTDDAFAVLEALNDSFMNRHPDIKVQLTNHLGASLYDYLYEAFRLGELSDIMLLDNEKVMQYAVMARLRPADDYYTRDTETVYLPAMTEQLKWNGYIWGIPFQVQPYIIAYHEQAWYALTGEVRPANVDQVISAYQNHHLYIEDEDLLAYAAFVSALDENWQFPRLPAGEGTPEEIPEGTLDEAAGETSDETASEEADEELSPPDDAGASAVTNEGLPDGQPEAMTAQQADEDLAERVDAVGEHTESERATGYDDLTSLLLDETADVWDRLAAGEIAAAIVPLYEYEVHRSGPVSAVMLPTAGSDSAAFLSGRSFVLSSETTDQEAAFRWIREVTNSYNEVFRDQSTGAYPANSAAYEQITISERSSYALLLAAIEQGEALLPDLLIQEKLETVRELLSEQLAAEAAIADLAPLITQRFEEAGFLTLP